ncbi:MAG: exodeoxyribonuclease V subunit RecC [Sodalis sp. Fse]|nr:MAG: exodeoxyribonuclease V subunit RecC [Sodalis sp. Fse]
MFTVYHSNQLNVLKRLAATVIAGQPLRDPFQPEVIQVQDIGMAQWMQIELAAQFGIAANIEFLLPAKFIWKMFTSVLPNIPIENTFSKLAITWKLMAILPRLCQQKNFDIIYQYLHEDDDKRKCFQFAERLADLFNQYLVYRPEWLDIWQRGEMVEKLEDSQRWQAPLWKALIEDIKRTEQPLWHHTNLYQCFIKTLNSSHIRPPGLPERVFICSSALPPTYLQALQALGCHIDIHLMFINPCRYYWGDIRDYSFLTQLKHKTRQHYQKQLKPKLFRVTEQTDDLFNDQGELQVGNPLLTSWGKLGRDNLYLLYQLANIQEVDAFVDPAGDCLLSLLQRDILELEDHTVVGVNYDTLKNNQCKRLLRPEDRSLCLHICHSPQREIEVLHDNLLAMMADDPSLAPHEVIVMAANIDRYTPAIQTVFGNTAAGCYLPFAISDRQARHIHPVLSAFLNLLELPQNRFTAEQGLALLEVPALAARFSINEKNFKLLRHWVAESGIRWGLDDDTLRELKLPITGQHTWSFGLTRMLLGYAMDSQKGDWQGIMPYDESSGQIASLAGHLAEFLMLLRYWRDRCAHPRTLENWLSCAREIIDDFFSPDIDADAALALLESYWQQLLQCGLEAGYDQLVPVRLLHDKLSDLLDQERISQQFLTGAINFCNLTPGRPIPFKVICLLGMNDGVYPRTLLTVNFDLMAKQIHRGDRNKRDEDRYLFLETLLSAQQRLYISFIGRDIQDNTPHYPSVLVSELCEYITRSFYLPGDELTETEISVERVRAHLWQWHSRMPFAPENFIPGSESQSFSEEWLPAARAMGKPHPDFVQPLNNLPVDILSFEELRRFYNHPVRAWFQQRLAVSYPQDTLKLATDEPFIIDGCTRYKLNERLVNAIINKQNTDMLYRQVYAAGLLPYGAFGKLYWTKQCLEMAILVEKIQTWLLPKNYSIEIILTLGDTKLIGWLPQVQDNGLLRWRPGTLSTKDGLLLWLEHLIYCAIGGSGESRIFGSSGEWHFTSLSSDKAKEYLLSMISGYYQGMTTPLLLNRSGSAWLTHCFDRQIQNIDWEESRQQQARDKLIKAWQGDGYVTGENNDPYMQRLIRQLDKTHIEDIILAAQRYFLPPFILNVAQKS